MRLITFSLVSSLLFGLFAYPSVFAADDSTTNAEGTEANDAEGSDGRMSTEDAIAMFEQRTASTKSDFLSLTVLGQLYLRHAKEGDDLPSYAKAEDAFRAALKIKPDHHSAMTYLAITLEARHQFSEALELASIVAAVSERETLALATMGDCQLHLGRYEEAEKTYRLLAERATSPAVIARLAHLSELQGHPDTAVEQIEEAIELGRMLGSEGEDLAWYEMRLGTLRMSQGKLPEAEKHFRNSLELSKDYSAAMMGLAEACALQGRLDEAETTYTTAVDRHGEPPAMAGLGDVLVKKGDAASAKVWYLKAEEKMVEEAKTAAAAHYREVAMFYANHDMNPQRALELAEMDLRQRQDIHGYDTLAWALYRNQKFDQALVKIQAARRLGTRDAGIHFHAGMIYLALGNRELAKTELSTAMEINPHFSVLYADVAANELRKLESIQ